MTASALSPIPLSEVASVRFGHWTDAAAGTGCTVIVAPNGATAGVDVRGGAPASRETDLLRPENTVQQIHAVCLSGGSAFGLEAASGVARELESRGIGLDTGAALVPIVCSSCIFDLAFGDATVRPDVAAGRAATAAALDDDPTVPLAEGSVGAGAGATVGKLNGPACAMKGGLGARAFSLGNLHVGAIAVVNACGNVCDPTTGAAIAGMRSTPDARESADMEDAMLAAGANAQMPLDRTNTTISCIVTNARLTKAETAKVAQMATDAYAHVIRPTHTTNDGDTVYVMATGELEGDQPPLDVIGLAATRALEAALVAGVTEATGSHGIPAACDLA
ncbi:P1 family peptidase [Collinsella sp. An268]|uniref:P1 family peptidase n=1 Tax=Collinsella sp. An268 TaxID=1965612 RepID=UPI000B373803|nr:P1 family peptidase [Collinsella sp. An268]OUO65109.1 hypothetical protein B5F70_00105 [Collinsella sp. An268]